MAKIKITSGIFLSMCLILLLNACSNQSAELTEEDKTQINAEVRQSFESLVQATEESDWEVYFAHFDQNKFSGLNADGTVWTSFKEFKESVTPAFESIEESEHLEFTKVEVTVIDSKTAVLVNEYEQQILLLNDQSISISGGGTQVWSKTSGTWKLISVSASSKP